MISISLKDNLAEISRTLTVLEREAIPRALPTAINRTGRHAESVGVKIVARVMGASQASVRKRIHRQLARRARPVLVITAFGSKLNIASFKGVRQTKKGVRSRAFGTSRVYPRTFLIYGDRVAMKRLGKSRLPIKPVYGPGIGREFERNRAAIEAAARAVFPARMDDALRAAGRGFIK